MKLPLIIFCSSLLALFAGDFFLTVLPQSQIRAQGKNHPEVQDFLHNLENVVDATKGAVVEKRFSVGFLNRVTINPGIRLIHDPRLGREVVASGPEAALEHLKMGHKTGRLVPDFGRPVRLKNLVELRLNLHAHGSKEMRVAMRRVPAARTVFQPDFVTEGPLEFQMLRMANIPDHAIEINSQDVRVYTKDDLSAMHGTAGRLEIMYDTPKNENRMMIAPNLKAGEVILTEVVY